MARALIVGCGCRGRELANDLVEHGWLVRGTTRCADQVPRIEMTGASCVLADPADPASVLDHVADAALVYWLLGSAAGTDRELADLHGPLLARVLEELVDTPVRGFVYEAAGTAGDVLASGAEIVREAADRWRMRTWVLAAAPHDLPAWREAMLGPAVRLAGGSLS